jgi:hypothetical protein
MVTWWISPSEHDLLHPLTTDSADPSMKLVGRIRSEPQAEVFVNLLGVFPYEAIGTRWHNVVNPMP